MSKPTRDHVFPKSWYPDNTPNEVQRPIAPSCGECNNSLGTMERELFYRMAVCIDPQKAEASGINKKVLRSFGIGNENELSPGEITIRKKALQKILKETTPYTSNIKPFPGLGLHAGFPPERQMVMKVPKEELLTVSKKIVRGLEYIHGNDRYIELPYEVEVYFVDEDKKTAIEAVYSLMAKHGLKTNYGPGFEVERAAATDKTKSVIYKIKIWGSVVIYGSIMTPDDD